MSIFRCKMCGGTIEFEPGATVGVCDSCGTKQTLPRLDDDRRANLYGRANHFRRNNEYDKAAGLYEQILNEDNTDAEAYWSLVLCRYGTEYVEDPATHKRIPTVNRAQYTSIFDDDNYRSALQYADGYQRSLYEEEAAAINEIQKGILAISQKEQPFDVFICYKETDDSGRRTQDSVLANDLYHQLTQEGFKVFFSRITLEDKLGTAYEPYIFAALNSAKVMVALGTKPSYFNAVWVKNEWSRYLALVKESGGKKVLIPAYRDMDPYDLPEEFSHLQALDMSKLGFMQDLIRGIKKIVNADESKTMVKETVVVSGSGTDVEPLLERAFLFLEDGNFTGADEYCERVLDQAPKNAQAYLGKLMVEQKVRHQEDLADCAQPFDASDNYQKALRFGDDGLVSSLKGYVDQINDRIEAAQKEAVYAAAEAKMAGDKTGPYEKAIEEFRSISSWKDADEMLALCQRKIEEIKLKEEQDRIEKERKKEEARIAREQTTKKSKKVLAVVIPVVCACIVIALVVTNVIIPKQKMNQAMELLDAGDYDTAYVLLEELGNSDAIASNKRERATELLNSGEYDAAYSLLEQIGDKDTIASSKYDRAEALLDSGDYEAALMLLEGLNYKDSSQRIEQIQKDIGYIKSAQEGAIIRFGSYEQDNNTSNGKESIPWLILKREENRLLLISEYALDCQQFNTTPRYIHWELCSLRKWLNESFINTAFSEEERTMIPTVTVPADVIVDTIYVPPTDTQEQIFLLSVPEANQYFSSDSARQCKPTAYAEAHGCFSSESDGLCRWWLRSPSDNPWFIDYATYVVPLGDINETGGDADSKDNGVRPAMWIDLDA